MNKKKGFPFAGSNHRMTEFQAAILREQFKRFRKQDALRQRNGAYLEKTLTIAHPGLTGRKRYNPETRITYVKFELDYDPAQFQGVPADKFAEAVRAEGVPVTGGPRRYGSACHKHGMIEEHLNSRAFQASFSKARLDAYRKSLKELPVMNNREPSPKQMLKIDSKIPFLQSRKDMDDIAEAFAKVAKNLDKLAKG